MVVAKGLLLKGLGVCAICAGGATVALKWGDISSAFSSPISRKKIVWGGLECEEPTGQEGGGCSLKTGEKIFVKKADGSHFEVSNLGEGTGKIKVYKVQKEGDQGYNEGFKFLIEEGDIGTAANKLEEFESYEIKLGTETDGTELNGKHYLFRKTDSKTEIKNALGLPWDLPEGESGEHTGINDEQLKTIKFKGGTATITGENVTLTISKETKKAEYPLGYKFTFKNTNATAAATLKIGKETIALKNGSPIDYDFKIKREGLSLSLEKAWSLETFTEKIGLVKGSEGDYWDVGTSGLNVKVGTDKKDNKAKKDGTTGKIKVYEGQAEYNGGFKFTIEEGDLILKDNNSSDITLEEFQSYEIVKEDNKWYLSKKEEAKDGIKRALGLSCEFPADQTSSKDCPLTTQNIGSIKFKGGTPSLTGNNVTLKISKDTSKEEYPYGFKFSFKNSGEGDATLKTGKETLTLKKNSPVEFKIKKEGSSISLEKAWTLDDLTQKVGLVKQSDGSWDVGNSGLNIKQGTTKHTKKSKKDGASGKIKVYEGQAGYNEGFRFTIEDKDVTLNNGGSTSDIVLGQFHSYEIVKDEGTWYFSRKDEGQEKIKELLGLGYELPKEQSSKEYTLTNENIKTTKFDGAENKSATVTGSPKLTISKETERIDFPLGYKFTFSPEPNSTITIPTSSPSDPYIIGEGLSVDYKIKKDESNKSLLSLEKAWNPKSFMENVIWFVKGSKENEWVAGNVTVNIKQESHKTTDVKAKSDSNHAKIRVYEGVPGYKYGMKFVVEEGDTTFEEAKDSISKLTKYETYEVTKESGEWYLSRKLKAEDSMRELLGLPETCKMPTNETPLECSLDDSKLKAIKFEGKGNNAVTVTGSGSMKLAITKVTGNESEYPKGFKFTFKPDNKSFTIPQDGGSIEVNSGSNTEFKIKETGNTLTLEKVG